ncbi:pentraxin-related protein PTX3-like isoform X2 [Dunckerocampus dactyliophorus]|uniref:pentraxin-related protein PTX3-like isoform X2 n=1 Tax=Dunckerocampus dactyliophorus TaxID=161453 RepID=UPI00240646D3|nr:pentraxin-related protein PTX3-like isoform X2 [Dunckerocampus dactyliophorus]
MDALKVWQLLCVLGCVGASLHLNQVDYVDVYDNEVPQEESQQTPCLAAELTRWDKLFIALENSQMRQNMLLESSEKCCGGMVSLRAQVDHLARATSRQCSPCLGQAEQATLKMLHRGLAELREEAAERERRVNTTLQKILDSFPEEDGGKEGHLPTRRPEGSLAAVLGLGMKPFTSGLKEQEVTSPLDMASVEKALVAIATELQRVHVQLSRAIEQAGTLKKDRGDT